MKKNVLCITWICCFFLILLMPLIIYPAVKSRLDLNNYENRALMTSEDLLASDWKTFFPNLETYIEDHMLYKNESVNAINWVDEKVFHDLINKSVMVGKENWLFYKMDSCIQDYRGAYTLSEAELQEYVTAAQCLESALKNHGIELYLMITPNKETIYGDMYLPDKVKKTSDLSRADQVVNYLEENTDIKVIYPKDELHDAAEDYQVWKKYDTHWNPLGAFVGAQAVLSAIEKVDEIPLSSMTIIDVGLCSGDLANMLGRAKMYSDDIEYSVGGYNEDVSCVQTDYLLQSNLPYSKYESDAEKDLTVLFIGDSFLSAMEQYLARNFSKTMFVHRDNYTSLEEDLILDESPDIVVFQISERFLTYFDDTMLKYGTMYSE